jgi:N,N-dimethylformamidase
MKTRQIRGYCDRPNVRPGEALDFFVSSPTPGAYRTELVRLVHGDRNPLGPGYKEQAVAGAPHGELMATTQFTQLGGHVVVADAQGALAARAGLTLHLHLWSTLPAKRQGVVSRWCEAEGAGWALMIEDGHLVLVAGDGKRGVARRVTETAVSRSLVLGGGAHRCRGRRAHAVAGGDPQQRQQSFRAHGRSRFRRHRQHAELAAAPSGAGGAAGDGRRGERRGLGAAGAWRSTTASSTRRACGAFGLERHRLREPARGGALPGALAHWDFAAGITRDGIGTDAICDVSGLGYHGRCINQPDRGMTGWNWDGREEHFIHCPAQYGAMWFHEDSLDDSRWQKSLTLTIPADLPSGAYALKLVQGEAVDRVPFFVVPPRDQATARIAVVIPTFSYLAYANSQVLQNAATGQSVMG